jgi:hypothetical protein
MNGNDEVVWTHMRGADSDGDIKQLRIRGENEKAYAGYCGFLLNVPGGRTAGPISADKWWHVMKAAMIGDFEAA